jgi:predicted RecA/RadA family phage recombinase
MAKEAILYKDGKKIDLTLTGAVDVGDVVPLGLTMIGVASTSGLAGEIVALEVEGIYEINAATADAIAIGDKVYFDHINRVITVATDTVGDGTGDKYAVAGVATSAKSASVAGTVYVGIEYR